MKLLMIYCRRFGYRTALRNLDTEPDYHAEEAVEDAVVGFIHAEVQDENDAAGVEKKLVKNLKWAAGKNETRRVVLHSFAHLAETKASADFTRALLDRVQERLAGAGYQVHQTPFGYFLDLDLSAPGRSLARVFKSF